MSNELDFNALYQALCDRCDLEELRTLCAQLGIDFDSLRGEGKAAKGRELILWLQRRGRLNELARILNTARGGSASSANPASKYNIQIEHAEGIAIGDHAQVVPPGRIPTRPTAPTVSYSLLTRYLPTAYCRQLTVEQFPFVTITVDNTARGAAKAEIQAEVVIEDYSDTASWSLSAPESRIEQVRLLPVLRPQRIATLNEIRPATLHVKVVQGGAENHTLLDRTERIYLHARNTALLAVRAPDGQSIVDLGDYLAGWVTPHHPEVEKFLRRAAEHHFEQQFRG